MFILTDIKRIPQLRCKPGKAGSSTYAYQIKIASRWYSCERWMVAMIMREANQPFGSRIVGRAA